MGNPHKVEKRVHFVCETRDLNIKNDDGEDAEISGYAILYNKPSLKIGGRNGFVEQVKPGALDVTLRDNNSDPILNFDHQSQYILGRKSSGTLELKLDEKGLFFKNKPPNTMWAKDLMVSMKRGDIGKMSFEFDTIRDSWSDDYKKRDLLEVRLGAISLVASPAYPQTTAKLRDIAGAETLSDENIAKVEKFIRSLSVPAVEAEPEVIPAVEAVDPDWIRVCMDADCVLAGIPL